MAVKALSLGEIYILPKPFDPRVLWYVAPAVAKAAIESGVARVKIEDWEVYKEELKEKTWIIERNYPCNGSQSSRRVQEGCLS